MSAAIIVLALLLVSPTYASSAPDRCNFCSGSGQGKDCPRHNKHARKECIGGSNAVRKSP